jgi:hypothetical protein
MIHKWFCSLLWVLLVAAALQGQTRESLLKVVHDTSAWSPAGQPTLYDDNNLQTLAGKSATAIRHYGFSGATSQTWTGPEGNVTLILFEMADPTSAYGLFTIERNINQPGFDAIAVGTEGFRIGNRVEFWQSKYVVRLEGRPAAADALGRLVSQNIFGRSSKPTVSMHLPPENLVQGSERYVVDPTGIDRSLNLDPEALGFNDSVEIATADYRAGGKVAHLILLLYPTQQLAKKYEDQWTATAPDDAPFRKRIGPLLALVRGLRDPAASQSILDRVNHEYKVTWDEPRPDISLRQVILTIFTFIGVGLLFTFVAGLSYGGLRIFVKARYPDRVFDRSQDMEIIQLKLGQRVTPRQLGE